MASPASAELPVLVVGAGVSGLLLAQHLRRAGVSFRIFERDDDFSTRGVGWGLTLHWSLPALRSLLPPDLVERIPEAYVDRVAVENGEASTFPFFDLATGELKAAVPRVPEAHRIRVSRERLRRLLAVGIDIQWGKSFREFKSNADSVTAWFDDGSTCTGNLLVACDGTHSRVRRALFPELHRTYQIPVRVLGLKVEYTPERIMPLRKLDPFTLQGTSSQNNTYIYFSFLDAPGNDPNFSKYSCQMVISWPIRKGFFGQLAPLPVPPTSAERLELIRSFGKSWAEPFRSLIQEIPEDTEVKSLELADFPPPKGLRGHGNVVLVGDSLHAMAMYRGEGANHAIWDVLDFAELITSLLPGQSQQGTRDLRTAIDVYEERVVARARPAVLASRKACLDAHDWSKINPQSPLLSKRTMMLDFVEEV